LCKEEELGKAVLKKCAGARALLAVDAQSAAARADRSGGVWFDLYKQASDRGDCGLDHAWNFSRDW